MSCSHVPHHYFKALAVTCWSQTWKLAFLQTTQQSFRFVYLFAQRVDHRTSSKQSDQRCLWSKLTCQECQSPKQQYTDLRWCDRDRYNIISISIFDIMIYHSFETSKFQIDTQHAKPQLLSHISSSSSRLIWHFNRLPSSQANRCVPPQRQYREDYHVY